MLTSATVSAKGAHQLVVNGKELAASAYLNKQNEMMIPTRAAAEQLGYKLTWKSNRPDAGNEQGQPVFHCIFHWGLLPSLWTGKPTSRFRFSAKS